MQFEAKIVDNKDLWAVSWVLNLYKIRDIFLTKLDKIYNQQEKIVSLAIQIFSESMFQTINAVTAFEVTSFHVDK